MFSCLWKGIYSSALTCPRDEVLEKTDQNTAFRQTYPMYIKLQLKRLKYASLTLRSKIQEQNLKEAVFGTAFPAQEFPFF